MGFLDAVKGLFQSDVVQGALDSTGLADQVGSHLGEGVAIAETVGVDPGQLTEAVPGGDVLAEDVLAAGASIDQMGMPDPPRP